NSVTVAGNVIGPVDASGTTATTGGGFTGIDLAGTGGTHSATSNSVGNGSSDNIRTGYLTTTGVSGGPLSNAGILTSTTGTSTLIGIRNAATGATCNLSSNTLTGWATSGTTAPAT